ncbi:MAG: fluoride efflux transporter FluC [Balneolaceae bacterium]
MTQILLVALGGAIGAVCRFLTGLAIHRMAGRSKVLTGTVIANALGCLIAGILLGWFTATEQSGGGMGLFLTVGILGSYTTFSAFSLEVSQLLKESWGELSAYLFLQLVLAILLCAAGYIATLWMLGGLNG